MPADPWTQYSVGLPSDRHNWTNPDCQPMSAVYHVTHIDNALAILKGGVILPTLVYDESILNSDRILVNWLSPNHWNDGYRYGNISFAYNFKQLVTGKNYYWVEAMTVYNPSALRILITDQDRSNDPRLRPYDPTKHGGPWWYDEPHGVHYRNGDFTLEFMIEEPLQPFDATEIGVVKHHEKFCCIKHGYCAEKGMREEAAALKFAAGVVLSELDCRHLPFSEWAYTNIRQSLLRQYHAIPKYEAIGLPGGIADRSTTLVRAWLSAAFYGKSTEIKTLSAMFGGQDPFWHALTSVFSKCFDESKLCLNGKEEE